MTPAGAAPLTVEPMRAALADAAAMLELAILNAARSRKPQRARTAAKRRFFCAAGEIALARAVYHLAVAGIYESIHATRRADS